MTVNNNVLDPGSAQGVGCYPKLKPDPNNTLYCYDNTVSYTRSHNTIIPNLVSTCP